MLSVANLSYLVPCVHGGQERRTWHEGAPRTNRPASEFAGPPWLARCLAGCWRCLRQKTVYDETSLRITLKDFAPLTPPIDSANIRDSSAGGQGQGSLPKRVKLLAKAHLIFISKESSQLKRDNTPGMAYKTKLETKLYWVVTLRRHHSNINFNITKLRWFNKFQTKRL